jgi:class 3 adenylate cyclase
MNVQPASGKTMGSSDARFAALRKVADPAVAEAIERTVQQGGDRDLFRVDVLTWAADRNLDEDRAIDAFVHASNLGLFEMSWNLLCPSCGGVLGENSSLRGIKEEYACGLCAGAYQPKLDEMVEVSFTVSPGVRRIAHHTPDSLPMWDYARDMYFGNGVEIPDPTTWHAHHKKYVVEAEELPPRGRVVLAVQLPSNFTIVFDPVTHATAFVDVQGEPTRERQDLSLVFDASGVTPSRVVLRPGPCRIALENRTERRLLPAIYEANDDFHRMFEQRQAFLTARRMFTNQTFRDVYRAGTLDIDQRLKLTSLTVLFTDLKGSTALYERVGDLAAYDLVRAHFGKMADIVRGWSGAVVKTIGDAVMATFDTPDDGLAAALDMRRAMDGLRSHPAEGDLQIKIGLHEGPCLAVTSNDRLDYFGQTVNIAARVQGLAEGRAIYATEPVVKHAAASQLLSDEGLVAKPKRALLKGIKDELTVYEIGW